MVAAMIKMSQVAMFARIKSFKLPKPISMPKLLLQQLLSKVVTIRDQLSLGQKFYLLAMVLLLLNQPLTWVASMSLLAILLEFWPVFEKVWNSLAGKAVLLLFYAIIANFALANASAVVNEVVGVPAQHFNYTHNFAILLYIPAWFIIISGIVMFIVQIMSPMYFVLMWLLKPLGIYSPKLVAYQAFHRITFIIRIILSVIVLYHLWMLIGLDFEDDIDDPNSQFSQVLMGQDEQIKEEIKSQLEQTQLVKEQKALANDDEVLRMDVNMDKEIDFKQVHQDYYRGVRKAIAFFAFTFEADTFSRCDKAPNSHVVELNDYEILEIVPDKQSQYGYLFSIKQCYSAAFPLNK